MWDEEHEKTLETLRNGDPLAVAPPPRVVIDYKKKPADKGHAESSIQALKDLMAKPK
jgi:hypothetical protein